MLRRTEALYTIGEETKIASDRNNEPWQRGNRPGDQNVVQKTGKNRAGFALGKRSQRGSDRCKD